jgi:hypothetical protein
MFPPSVDFAGMAKGIQITVTPGSATIRDLLQTLKISWSPEERMQSDLENCGG